MTKQTDLMAALSDQLDPTIDTDSLESELKSTAASNSSNQREISLEDENLESNSLEAILEANIGPTPNKSKSLHPLNVDFDPEVSLEALLLQSPHGTPQQQKDDDHNLPNNNQGKADCDGDDSHAFVPKEAKKQSTNSTSSLDGIHENKVLSGSIDYLKDDFDSPNQDGSFKSIFKVEQDLTPENDLSSPIALPSSPKFNEFSREVCDKDIPTHPNANDPNKPGNSHTLRKSKVVSEFNRHGNPLKKCTKKKAPAKHGGIYSLLLRNSSKASSSMSSKPVLVSKNGVISSVSDTADCPTDDNHKQNTNTSISKVDKKHPQHGGIYRMLRRKSKEPNDVRNGK